MLGRSLASGLAGPLALLALPSPAAAEAEDRRTASDELTERLRTGAAQGDDRSGDVRPEALELEAAAAAAHPEPLSLSGAPAGAAPLATGAFEPPETIRVWRRGIDGSSTSCSGRVDEIPFERYVRGVLPHEWIPSWHEESLKAGAVAIRTYAAFLVETGGRYDCAHVDDTTSTQVYEEDFDPRTDAAVEATAELYVVDEAGELILAEYSAENGDPTEFGVDEPLCSGEAVFGHGRGTCQWGSQRWALDGRSFDEIVTHYYPGSSLYDARRPAGAAEVERDVPESLAPGASARVELAFENTGTETWTPSATALLTSPSSRVSNFYDEASWESGDRPGAVEGEIAPGEVGRFSFSLRAPEDAEAPTAHTESFRIAHDGERAGPVIRLEVEIVEGPGDGSGGDGEAGASAAVSGGCHVGATGAAPGALAALGFVLGLLAIRIRPGKARAFCARA